jgi:hypothetical protein|tara:strand:+ start:948 stop:1049 length:102 start_codon:yes stop_codon:yes gene_type:complete
MQELNVDTTNNNKMIFFITTIYNNLKEEDMPMI